MPNRKTVLVTGVTGRQGGAVARCLLEKGQNVRVMTRDPDKARAVARLGASVVRGDFEDRDSLSKAVRGVEGVFVMGTPFEKGAKAESLQGEAILAACWREGIPHIVYTSVASADRGTGIPHFESKARVEAYLRQTGQPFTILRPAFFMENFEAPWLLPSLMRGVVALPLLPDRKVQMVAVADIGEFASEAFLRPDDFLGRTIELAGDEVSMAEAVSLISFAMNRQVRYECIPDERAEEAVGTDMALMYRWFNREGYSVDIRNLWKDYGIPLTPFPKYVGRSMVYRRAA